MDNDKIISFEEYRKKKLGSSYKQDIFSELFNKDLRDQDDLIEWYQFHNRFNKHKLFIHCFFLSNHKNGNVNPNSAFLIANNKEELQKQTSSIIEAVKGKIENSLLLRLQKKLIDNLHKSFQSSPLKQILTHIRHSKIFFLKRIRF